MRIHAAIAATCLAGTAALGGCADIPFTGGNFTLSPAASMRVEVEVYKGPLSKTLPVQLGELEGLVDTAVVLLGDFGEVICRMSDPKNSESTDNGEDRNSSSSGCRNESDTAQSADVGDQIIRGMHADAQRLMEEAKGLREVVRRTRPGSPGCHINQALEALAGPGIGPCSASSARPANMPAKKAIGETHYQIQAIEGATNAIGERVTEVQKVAAIAGASVETAKKAIGDADNQIQAIEGATNAIDERVTEVQKATATAGANVETAEKTIGETDNQKRDSRAAIEGAATGATQGSPDIDASV